jgi:3-oxoacyl-[acyl-carrier-protein] synthase-3
VPCAKIIGTGICLPPIEATNEAIGRFFPAPPGREWTPEWVEHRLGILTRRSTFDFETGQLVAGYHDGDMAYRAAKMASENAEIAPGAIERVIYATSTPEQLMPDPACVLHGRLGLSQDASALGLSSVGCGGFIYAMDLADSDIRSGKYRTVLLVGVVSVGPYIQAIAGNPDAEERRTHLLQNLTNAYIFGEGAGAMILQATEDDAGILHTYVGASHLDNPVVFEAGGSRMPATHRTVREGRHRFDLDVRLVKTEGPRLFVRAVDTIRARSQRELRAINHFIFHQVNGRLLRRIATSLGIPMERLLVHVDHYGNLDTATLPVAFHEGRATGRIQPGDLVLFAAVGAGWQFGAAIVRA